MSRGKRRTADSRVAEGADTTQADRPSAAQRQLRFGWWSLTVFLTVGLVLEGLHGFKVAMYLDLANETRRLLWTLGHAHGTLFAMINIVFALTTASGAVAAGPLAGRCLMAATVLLPAGFFLGGAVIYDGDPGLGVLLVPVGGLLLLIGVVLTAWQIRSR